ncbi:hypothetical protein F4777DRAFT_543702 [Nemania sp. FL0916]|nr:hypothetical protein F4777DRAFT_543702 [Nemania sp. FL0916]
MSALFDIPLIDLCAIPAAPSPDGGPPNFHDPVSLQITITVIAAIVFTLAAVTSAGRLYVNRRCLKISDYVMIVALALDAATIGVILAVSKTYRHQWDVPACWLDVRYLKIIYADELLVGPALFFAKAAIFLLYRQLFAADKRVRIGVYFGLAGSFLGYFATTLVFAYYSAPHVGQTWEQLLLLELENKGGGRQAVPSGVTLGALSILIDLYIFILPLPTLFRLNMALSKKIQVIALFAAAFFGIVASGVCLVYRIKLLSNYDSTWTAANAHIPIIVENNVAITVGSLPAFSHFLRIYVADSVLYKRLRSKISTTRIRSGSSKSGSSSPKPAIWTFGQGKRPREFHELTDSAILNTDVTATRDVAGTNDSCEGGITYTVGLAQVGERSQSSERLTNP